MENNNIAQSSISSMERYPEDVDGNRESEFEEGSIVVFPGKE